ncbi:MAG: hypothetical protein RLZZ511_4010 [Cyanobacteriota bacterium]|jgi:CHAT domain-containing protein/Flp pilus assembly protein TadD
MVSCRSTIQVSLLLTLVGTIAPQPITASPTIAPVIAQGSPVEEIDRAMAEGMQLFQEGSVESLKKAIIQFEKALQLARSANIQDTQAPILLALGRIYSDLGEKQKAIRFYNQALLLLRAVGDRGVEATTLNSIGSIYNDLGEQKKALEFYNQALSLRRAVGDRGGEAVTLNNIGLIYDALGEKKKALEFYNRALSLRRAVGDRRGEARTLNNIGNVYDALGEKKKALEFHNQALVIRRAVDDRRGEATTLNNIGGIYADLSERQKALEFYNQALSLRRTMGDRGGEATTLNNIGAVYNALGEQQKALEFYNQALPLYRMLGYRSGEATILNNIGRIYNALSEQQNALELYNQALTLYRAIGDRSNEATIFNNIAGVHDALGEQQKALEFLNQALPLYRSLGDRSGEATTLNNVGGIYADLGEGQKALEFLNQALPLYRIVRDRSGEATALNNLGTVSNSQKQPGLAIAFYKQSVNLHESLRQEIRTLPREVQEKYTSTVARTYRTLAGLLLSQGRNREAQAILELLKVQEFQGYATNQETKQPAIVFPMHPLETAALKQFEQITTARSSLDLVALTQLGRPLSQNLDRITQDMNNMPIAIGNPNNLLNAKPNTILIQNIVVGDKIWVIWTNSSGTVKTALVPNIPQAQLTKTVETFRQQIDNPSSNLQQLQTISQKLYNWLIPPPLQTELANNPNLQLIFSLDHVTRYIPVAALYDGKQYLAQRHTLSNLITTDTDMIDRLTPQGRSPSILALGTTNAYPGFNPLPNVQAELDAIVKESNDSGIFPGTVRLNASFTADSLRGKLDAYRVLHIATHGSFNPKSITASFLLLGNGDKLPITEIAGLHNLDSNHLVVLSACETGLSGVSPDGSEISGISGYFLRRGAKSVMASLWAVNDASTALLMQQFYQRLSQGMTKAAAIQAVQQDFISGKLTANEAQSIARAGARPDIEGQPPPNSFSHPYFWAPFILIGNNL